MKTNMPDSVENALKKLERAVALLEGAVALKLDSEKRKGTIELELQLMQDDRMKLAEELDGTTHRLRRIENVVANVDEHVEQVIDNIESVLATSGESEE